MQVPVHFPNPLGREIENAVPGVGNGTGGTWAAGKPVALVRTRADGVPSAGVVIEQEVVKQTLPLPLPATKLIILGSVVPVLSINPVAGAAGRVIMNLVVTEVGAWNPTLEVGAVVAVPCPIAV